MHRLAAALILTASFAQAQTHAQAQSTDPQASGSQYTATGRLMPKPRPDADPRGPGAGPVTNAFTYQGRLDDNGNPANGQYDLRFTLLDGVGGVVAGPTCIDNVQVTDGVFAVQLDFGSVFTGEARLLNIAVRPGGAVGNCASGPAYTSLAPDQSLTATPYALGLRFPFQGIQQIDGASLLHITNPTSANSSYGLRGTHGGEPTFGFIDSAGVRGESAGGFAGAGVLGISESYIGVVGYTPGGLGTSGTFGRTDGESSNGVWGWATNANAVGVRGTASDPASWAGYFQGRVNVENKLTANTVQITANAGAGRVLVSDAAGNATWTQMNHAFAVGGSPGITSSTAFISQVATITVTEGQRILITVNQALGSTVSGGASGLDIYAGYRPQGQTGLTAVGGGMFGLTVGQNQRHTFGISAITPPLFAGTYEVGLAGSSNVPANWNNNEWGYVTAFALN